MAHTMPNSLKEKRKVNGIAQTGGAQTKKVSNPKIYIAILFGIVVVVIILFLFLPKQINDNSIEVITVQTLEKIINVSELSTFTAVYNGVAEVKNEKTPDKIEYYVSYNAQVKAGIDIEKIDISLDDTSMVIRVKLPDVHITDIIVDISSMDFIFYNKKADTATISSTAYRACEDDVKNESENQVEILELAHQNAVNIITALISPIIEQMDIGYTLHVE